MPNISSWHKWAVTSKKRLSRIEKGRSSNIEGHETFAAIIRRKLSGSTSIFCNMQSSHFHAISRACFLDIWKLDLQTGIAVMTVCQWHSLSFPIPWTSHSAMSLTPCLNDFFFAVQISLGHSESTKYSSVKMNPCYSSLLQVMMTGAILLLACSAGMPIGWVLRRYFITFIFIIKRERKKYHKNVDFLSQ